MKLTHENLQGSWIVVGSEIEHVKAGDEVYHFTPPDRFVMEFKQPNGRTYPSKQRYQLIDDGFLFGREGNLRCAVTAWIESGFLIFRPDHGKETWSTRLTTEEPNKACLICEEEKEPNNKGRDAPTGHKLFKFISISFQSRRWAHIKRSAETEDAHGKSNHTWR